MIGTGAMCDPYLQVEEKLKLTRRCLELIDKYEYGVAIQTKSTRILRDMDILKSINAKAKAVVQMTMTTYDETLCKILEPNVSTTHERFEALMQFKKAGIPTVVWLTPILPFINDTKENINGILDYCMEAGVKGIICFNMGVTLRDGDREYFYQALDRYFSGLKKNTSIHMEMHMIWQALITRNLWICSEKDAPKMELSMIQMSVSGIFMSYRINMFRCF